MDTEDRITKILETFGALTGDRGNFESMWEDAARHLIPQYTQTFNPYSWKSSGQRSAERIFHGGPLVWLDQGVAVLQHLVTPPTQTWHDIRAKRPELRKVKNVRAYCQDLTKELFEMRYAPEANFAAQTQLVYKSVLAFGHGVLFTGGSYDSPGTWYKNLGIGSCYFTEDYRGNIDSMYRYDRLTARQMMSEAKWSENIPEVVKSAAVQAPLRKFAVLHVCRPRDNPDPERLDAKGMAIEELYIDLETKTLLSEDGYRVAPFSVARWAMSMGEIYPRGPGIEQLSSIKMINEMAKTMLRHGHKIVEPAYIAGAYNAAAAAFSSRPGAVNYGFVSPEGKQTMFAMPTGNLADGYKLMDGLIAVIRAAFMVDIFQVLIADRPTITATETLELKEEKGIFLSPKVAGLQPGFLAPVVKREVDVGISNGSLPFPPEEMLTDVEDDDYSLGFESPITRLQKAAEATGAERQLQAAAAMSAALQRPDMMDVYDLDKFTTGTAQIRGYPEDWMLDENEVAAIREERAAAQQQQQLVAAAPGAAALGKVMVMASEGKTGAKGPNRN